MRQRETRWPMLEPLRTSARSTPVVRQEIPRFEFPNQRGLHGAHDQNAIGIGNKFPVAMIDELATTDAAIRADRTRDFRADDGRPHRARFVRHRLESGFVLALAKLAPKRPSESKDIVMIFASVAATGRFRIAAAVNSCPHDIPGDF